jgi:hypothetical protein
MYLTRAELHLVVDISRHQLFEKKVLNHLFHAIYLYIELTSEST